jgi:hypothetical protein
MMNGVLVGVVQVGTGGGGVEVVANDNGGYVTVDAAVGPGVHLFTIA